MRDSCKLIEFASREENMLTTLMNGFRNGILAIFLIAFPLSGCIAYIAHDISKGNPPAPAAAEPPEPSGTMLKSQFRIGISPDYMPLAANASAAEIRYRACWRRGHISTLPWRVFR